MTWLTDDLLVDVRRSGYLPDAHDFGDSDLLKFGDEELATTFAATIKAAREGYRERTEDVALVAGQLRYRMPRRALAGTVSTVRFVDSSGNESPASELTTEDAWRYAQAPSNTAGLLYVWEDDEIVLRTAPATSSGSIRFRFLERMPRMVVSTSCSQIERGLTTTTMEMAGTPPAGISTLAARIDIVRGVSPFPTICRDRIIVSFTSTLNLNAATPIVVADINDSGDLGTDRDYACPRDTTCYPPLPQEMHGVLALAIVRRALSALGDPKLGPAEADLRQRLASSISIINPRNAAGKPRIIDHGSRLRRHRRTAYR